MSTEPLNAEDQHHYLSWQKSHKRGKMAAGIIIVIYGTLFLLKELDVWLPSWTFSIGPIIMSVGLIVLIKHKFKVVFGYLLLLVGKLLLLKEIYPDKIDINLLWPILAILMGLGILFRSGRRPRCRNRHHHHHGRHHWKKEERWEKYRTYFEASSDLDNIAQDDFIDAVSIFGGVQKNVVSKRFRGADIVTIFGGNELNLSQADFNEQIVMDITNIFGGTTLTVPNNWELKSEIMTIFGSLEDKRPLKPQDTDLPTKVVILRGTCMFGGIEINSFN
jgi:predicted membrane protein